MTDDSMRLDKWLWAARFFKTRSLAQEAIDGGKVQVDGARSKPGKAVRMGQTLEIRRGPDVWTVTVLALSGTRGPAAQAQALYAETDDSRALRDERAEQRRLNQVPRPEKWTKDKKKLRDIQKLLGRR